MKSSTKSTSLNAVISRAMLFVIIILTLINSGCSGSSSAGEIETDVLVIGAGASGTMASIQAARMGVMVVVMEETPWVGGMLTAAGVRLRLQTLLRSRAWRMVWILEPPRRSHPPIQRRTLQRLLPRATCAVARVEEHLNSEKREGTSEAFFVSIKLPVAV